MGKYLAALLCLVVLNASFSNGLFINKKISLLNSLKAKLGFGGHGNVHGGAGGHGNVHGGAGGHGSFDGGVGGGFGGGSGGGFDGGVGVGVGGGIGGNVGVGGGIGGNVGVGGGVDSGVGGGATGGVGGGAGNCRVVYDTVYETQYVVSETSQYNLSTSFSPNTHC